MTPRQRTLLALAADALDNGTDPFDTHFLAINRVTLDEANELAEHVADCIRAALHREIA